MNQNAEKSAEIPNENRLWGAFCQSQEDADFYVTWLGMIALRIARTQRNRPLEFRFSEGGAATSSVAPPRLEWVLKIILN